MNSSTIIPPSSLTVRSIASFRDELGLALAGPGDVVIDLSAVEAPDLSIVQLVEAARRQAARDGKALALASPASGPLADLLDRAGFGDLPPAGARFWFHGVPTR